MMWWVAGFAGRPALRIAGGESPRQRRLGVSRSGQRSDLIAGDQKHSGCCYAPRTLVALVERTNGYDMPSAGGSGGSPAKFNPLTLFIADSTPSSMHVCMACADVSTTDCINSRSDSEKRSSTNSVGS